MSPVLTPAKFTPRHLTDQSHTIRSSPSNHFPSPVPPPYFVLDLVTAGFFPDPTALASPCAAFHVLTNALCVLSVYFSALSSLTPTLAPSFENTTFFFSMCLVPRSASWFE